MERVFDLQPGAFLTQSVIVSRGAQPSIWRYQPVSPDALRVQNLSTGATFLLGRCSSPPTVADSPAVAGAAVAIPRSAAQPPLLPAPQVSLPEPPPQRRPTVASRALAEGGSPEDLLMLANISPDAPNAAIDLSGELAFLSGKAALCAAPESDPEFDARMTAARWFAARKLMVSGMPANCQEDASLDRLDGVVLLRRSLGRLAPALFNELAARLQANHAREFVVAAAVDLQAERDRRAIARAASEQAIGAGRPGFGYASLANASATVCVVADPTQERAWTAVLEQRRDDISLDVGRQMQPRLQMVDADTAYISGRLGNCGVLLAGAAQLATMFKAFERDQVKSSYGAIWFTPDAVQQVSAAISAGTVSALQAAENARQSAEQEQELRGRREKADGVRREQETRQLRATFGAPAAAARDMVGTQALTLFKDPRSGSPPWVASVFSDLAREAARRASEGWAYAEGSAEVVEYGRSSWSGRILETAVIRVRVRLKNADIGRYEDVCYDLGYQNDAEFHRVRSPRSLECADAEQRRKWLAGLGYESSWNAP